MKPVTDPELLEELNSAPQNTGSAFKPVEDPELLAALNAEEDAQNTVAEVSTVVEEVPAEEKATMLGNLLGAAETALTVTTSAAAEPLAGLYGIVALAGTGGDVSASVRAIEDARQALAYAPKTVEGQQQLEAVGEALSPVGETLTKVNESLGDFAYDTTGSPAAAAAAYSLVEGLMTVGPFAGVKGYKALKNSTEVKTAQKAMLESNVYKNSGDVATVKLSPKGDVIPDKIGQELVDTGFAPKYAAAISKATPESKAKMRSMFDKWKKGKDNDVFAMTSRMSEDVGSSVTRRIGALNQRRKTLGTELDNLVNKELATTPVQLREPIGEFFTALNKDFGIKPTISPDGTIKIPNYKGTPLEAKSMSSVRNLVDDTVLVLNQSVKNGSTNAKSAHKLKKTLDELVDAGKASEAGISNRTHGRLLGLRKGINNSLQESSSAYARVNGELSNIIEAMSPFDKYLKSGTWDDARVSNVVGAAMKNLSRDTKSAVELADDIGRLEAGVRKAGLNFGDDPRALVAFQKALKDQFELDAEALLKQAGKYDEAIMQGLVDAGASVVVGNVFGVAHDLAKLRRLGLSKRKAGQLAKQKEAAKVALEKALSP